MYTFEVTISKIIPLMQNEQDLTSLLDTQQNTLATVIADGDGLDNRSMALAAINISLLLFIAQAKLSLHGIGHVLLVAPLCLSMMCNIMSILPKRYVAPSIDLAEHPEYLEMDKEALTLQLLADTQLAISKNQKTNRTYWRFWMISLALTILGTITLFGILKV